MVPHFLHQSEVALGEIGFLLALNGTGAAVEKIACQRWGVGQRLQRRVHVACVADVLQTGQSCQHKFNVMTVQIMQGNLPLGFNN